MAKHRRFFLPFATLALFTSAACTLLLDRSATQCESDGDCSRFGAGSVCRDSICSSTSGDGSTQNDGNSNAETGPGTDAGSDAKFGHEGCVVVTPTNGTTNDEFANACTTSACVPFDDCDLLGLCDGGLLGPAPPDGGGSATPPGPDSGAAQTCESLAASNGKGVVYVTGSSNFPPFLKAFAPILAKDNYAVVWQTSNSCTGVDSAYNGDPSKRQMKERAGRITEYYDATGTAIPCVIAGPTGTGVAQVDVGESDIYGDTCKATVGYDPGTVPAGTVGEYFGPIMAMTFVVNGRSNQVAISAAAAQSVFGRGGVPDTGKLPYNDPAYFYNRASSTATNQIISRGIAVEPSKWWGVDKRTASNMAVSIEQVPESVANKAIGIISTDFADSNRQNLTTLAFQAQQQKCAFWPDSQKFAFDKRNVRDGHYPLWGPLHFFTRLVASEPTPAAGAFVLRFSVPKLDEALVRGIIESHNVPACAMRVTRTTEMGPITKFVPPSSTSCECFFDQVATNQVPAECATCSSSSTCPASRPVCNYGYCERAD